MNDVLAPENTVDERTAGSVGPAWPTTQEEWLARVAAVGPIAQADAPEADRLGRLTDGTQAALQEQGLFRLLLPRVLGGVELDLPTFFAIIEALGKYDGSAAWCVCQGNGCALLGSYLDREAADAIWLDNPKGILAWGPGKAEARAVDGGYSVTARCGFVSGSNHASWIGAHCMVVEEDGAPRLDEDGVQENRTCVFPATATKLSNDWDAIGLRGSGSDSYTVEDMFVPTEHTIVRAKMVATRTPRTSLHYLPLMSVYSIGFAAIALGLARTFHDEFMKLAMDKKPRNKTAALKDNAVVQTEVAVTDAKISSARAYLLGAAEEGWAEMQKSGRMTVEQRMRIRLAGTYAIHEAKEALDTLYDAAGTSAIFPSTPFERRFRDIHTVAQQIQGRKSHFQTVGEWMFGASVNPDNMSVI